MLDIDLEEALVQKCGGKFALTALLQKRVVELNRGRPPLVKWDGNKRDLRRIACQEILEGKIELAIRGAVEEPQETEKIRIETAEPAPAEALPEDSKEIFGSDIKKIKEQRIRELAQLLNPKK